MAMMRTNRLTSKTTPPKTRKFVPASELAAQDEAFKTSNQNYEAQMKTYKNVPKGEKVYSQFGGGPVDLSPAGLAQYNKMKGADEPEATRVERPKAGGSEADYLKRLEGKGGFVGHVTYKEPTKPTNKRADWSAVQLDKMPTKKAKIAVPQGKLRQAKPAAEKPVFEAPASTRSKTRTSAAMTGGGKSGLTRATNPKGSLGAAKVTTTVNKAGRGYNKEAKQFAAYANPTASGTYLNTASKPEIMRMRAESKGIQKEYRKEGNKEGAKMMRSEAKQLKTAGKFADKVYEKGGGKYFKGSMVDQYRKSK
jgi:hypothetical protein